MGTSFGPTKSAPCLTDVDSQTQAERVTAEIRLLTGLPQQQPAETPPKVTTEEKSQLPAPDLLPPFEPVQPTNFTWGNRTTKKYQPPSTTSMMR